MQSGLVAVGQGWVIGFVGVAFGMSGGEWVIVVVDGWWLMVWVWLVVVGGAAVARRGSRWVDGGSGRCGWVCWWFMGLDGGVPYFPMECLPFWWDSVLGNAVSVSSGAVGRMRHRCSRGVIRRGGQVGSEWSWSHRQQMQKGRDSMRLWVSL